MAIVLSGNLIDRNAHVNIFASGLPSSSTREKGRTSASMIACAIVPRGGILVIETTQDLYLLLDRLQRLHRAIEFELGAFALGKPVILLEPLGIDMNAIRSGAPLGVVASVLAVCPSPTQAATTQTQAVPEPHKNHAENDVD